MKRRWIIVLPALLTAIGLGVAARAHVRRHGTESRLMEWEKTDRAVQAAILAARTPAVVPPRPADLSQEASASTAVAPGSEREAHALPDLNEIFSSHPELQAAYNQAIAGRLHQTYDRLFGRMGLSSAQIERIVNLLMRDDENEMDLAMTASALKLSADDPALREFRRQETTETDSALASLLGPQGLQALQDYNRILGIRSTADDVASFAVASDSPLTGEQTEQLTQVMAEATANYRSGGRPDWKTVDWDVVLGRAAAFLTPPQLAALRAKAQQARTAGMLSQFYAGRAPH